MSYSPTLGRFLECDLIGYDDGMNPYQFVHGSPAKLVDPFGMAADDPTVGTEAGDIAIVRQEAKENWQGRDFAIALMEAFLRRKFPSGDAGLSFNSFAGEIRDSKLFRDAALKYFHHLAVQKWKTGEYNLPDMDTRPPNGKEAFGVHYGFFGSDLASALGGAHFGYQNAKLTICNGSTGFQWSVKATMLQTDHYTFPNAKVWWFFTRGNYLPYAAYNDLEVNFGYKPFYHTEKWDDSFKGTAVLVTSDGEVADDQN